jgi:hypothetical protein
MLIQAVELGALTHFKVEGQWNNDLMKQVSHSRLLQLKFPRKNRIDPSAYDQLES